jgi:Secretion system C-terminal sorting domain
MKRLYGQAAPYASKKNYVKKLLVFIAVVLWGQSTRAQAPVLTGKLTNGDQVILSWQMPGEINVAKYQVEWSSDSRNWQPIGNVSASDSNGTADYSWTYSQPSLINFYRLKIINLDGNFSFSSIIRINGSDKAIVIYPNPAKNNVIISSFSDKPATVIFINSSGKALLRKTLNEPVTRIDISNFASGNYLIRIIRDNKVAVYQLIKE